MNLDLKYKKNELINTVDYLVKSSNLLHNKLTDHKGEVVKVSYESDQIIEIICKDFNFIQRFKLWY